MNILLISNLYPEPKEYGINPDTKAVHYFAKEWKKKGQNVLVLHPFFNSLKKINRFISYNHEIKEYCIEGVPVVFGESQIFSPFKNASSKFQQKRLANRFQKYLEYYYPDFKPDRVVVHFPVISYVFNSYFLIKGKSYGTLHGIDIMTLSSLSEYRRRKLVAYLNNIYTGVYNRSNILSQQAQVCGIKSTGNNVVLSGIDNDLIAPINSIYTKLASPRNTIKLVYAGKINKQKNIGSIFYALSRLKNTIDFSFTLVGDGPELVSLKRLSYELDLSNRICFVGRKNRTEVSGYMSMSDVFIMLSKNETFGLVYLEAMGQGCLTIGSKGEGIDGVIKSGINGFLCAPDNIDEICQTLIHVASLDTDCFNEIAIAGYNTVVQMTSDKMADRYLKMMGVHHAV